MLNLFYVKIQLINSTFANFASQRIKLLNLFCLKIQLKASSSKICLTTYQFAELVLREHFNQYPLFFANFSSQRIQLLNLFCVSISFNSFYFSQFCLTTHQVAELVLREHFNEYPLFFANFGSQRIKLLNLFYVKIQLINSTFANFASQRIKLLNLFCLKIQLKASSSKICLTTYQFAELVLREHFNQYPLFFANFASQRIKLPNLFCVSTSINSFYFSQFCLTTHQVAEIVLHKHFNQSPFLPILPHNASSCSTCSA